jgi:hypothetical protein
MRTVATGPNGRYDTKFSTCMTQGLFGHLQDGVAQSRLVSLRDGARPILANNLMPHFTTHDVEHSDRVVGLIDKLIEPLQESSHRLSVRELLVLYATAYLHDIGMHYEAGSPVVQNALGGRIWEELSEDDRRDILRRHHPLISAELVTKSVRCDKPPIGFQLIDDDMPGAIACLCEAHGIDTKNPRYAELTADAPGLRMALLSGILRCADILEESRRRAGRSRAESLLLPIESQVHWWRHYYTADVTFDRSRRIIEVWFEFPAGSVDELRRIVPELQLPEVRTELERHQQAFAPYAFVWFVQPKISPHHTAEDVPERVLREMHLQLARRREQEAEDRQLALAHVLNDARPHFERRLAELRAQESTLPPELVVERLREVANDMRQLSATASARIVMREAFSRAEKLDGLTRLRAGVELLEMLVHATRFDEAVRLASQLASVASIFTTDKSEVRTYWDLKVQAELRAGFFENCRESIAQRQALGLGSPADPAMTAELEFFAAKAVSQERP